MFIYILNALIIIRSVCRSRAYGLVENVIPSMGPSIIILLFFPFHLDSIHRVHRIFCSRTTAESSSWFVCTDRLAHFACLSHSPVAPFNRTQFSHIFSIWFPSALDRFWSNFMPAKLAVSAKLSWKPKEEMKKKDRRRPPPSYRIMMEDESINFHVDIDNWTHSRQPQNDSTQHVHTMHTVHSCRHSVLAPEQNATAWLHVFCCSVTLDMHQTEDEQNRGGKKWKENLWIETAILLLHSIWILQTKCAYSIWSECLPLLSSQSNLFKRRTEVELWCTKYAFENAE